MQNDAMNIKSVVFHLESTLIEPHKNDATTITPLAPNPAAEAVLGYLRSKHIRLAISRIRLDQWQLVPQPIAVVANVNIQETIFVKVEPNRGVADQIYP